MLFEQRTRGFFTCFCHGSVKFPPWRARTEIRTGTRGEQQRDAGGRHNYTAQQDNHRLSERAELPGTQSSERFPFPGIALAPSWELAMTHPHLGRWEQSCYDVRTRECLLPNTSPARPQNDTSAPAFTGTGKRSSPKAEWGIFKLQQSAGLK